MFLFENIRLAISSLRSNKMRAVLTMLGIIIGITAVITITTLGNSLKNDSSQYMVRTFANMFHDLKYSILFEGVENEHDENRCKLMMAQYLQGYKYSKPIPIEELRKFLLHV